MPKQGGGRKGPQNENLQFNQENKDKVSGGGRKETDGGGFQQTGRDREREQWGEHPSEGLSYKEK